MNYKVGDIVLYQGLNATIVRIDMDQISISVVIPPSNVPVLRIVSERQIKPIGNTSLINRGDMVVYKGTQSKVLDIVSGSDIIIQLQNGSYKKVRIDEVVKADPTTEPTTQTTITPKQQPTLVKEKQKGKSFPASGTTLNQQTVSGPRSIQSNSNLIDQSMIIPIKKPGILSNESIKEVSIKIQKKPILITKPELQNLGKDIKLVNFFPLLSLLEGGDKPFSPRLINWVEPYEILGEKKTLFYTEVNSGLKVGDRVFIINGNYDSDLLIQLDKYKKGRDGYKVIFIDECRVALDIDYTDELPYLDEPIDEFIKVYYLKNDQEFIQANRQITTGEGKVQYKFEKHQNNIAFVDPSSGSFGPIIDGWGTNGGITGSIPGFYVRNGITQSWINISSDLMMSGSFSYALSATYSNNGRLKIMNDDFTYAGKKYKKGYVYKWFVGPTQSEWIVDVKYLKPFLTKTNFRDGNFKGTWNTGLYGSYNKIIPWEGGRAKFNSGSILNTVWKEGTINSNYTLKNSFFAGIDDSGLPFQKANLFNNSGRGFNFIIDSILEKSTISNGNFFNTTLGDSTATYSVVENHLLNSKFTYTNRVTKATFENCVINNSFIDNTELKNVRLNNTRLERSKSVNSYFKDCVFYYSNYNSESIVKILGYDELNANEFPSTTSTFSVGGSFEAKNSNNVVIKAYQKVYKFYISEQSFNRLNIGDEFYIKGLKLNNNSKEILNLFDKKFRVGTWIEYIDDYNQFTNSFYKRPIDVSVFLSTPLENSYLFEAVRTAELNPKYYTSVYSKNNKSLYSIDVWISLQDLNEQNSGFLTVYEPKLNTYLNLNTLDVPASNSTRIDYISVTGSGPDVIGNIVDFSEAYLVDADFDSGIFENSDWNSGNYSNSQNDLNITIPGSTGGAYNLSFTLSKSLTATSSYVQYQKTEMKSDLKPGQVVFLDAVDFNDGVTTTRLPDAYKVTSNNSGVYTIEEIVTGTSSKIISLSASTGTFYTDGSKNRWGYLKSLKFKNSKIKSGLLRRPYITSSLIENDNFDATDKDYNNLSRLRNLVITDLISSNKSNFLSSASYLFSDFSSGSDRWNNGIVQYSQWNSGTFSSGVIRESNWSNGVFTNGTFYRSRSFNANPTNDYQFYNTNRIYSYWKSGYTNGSPYTIVVGTTSNNRFSWENGIFSGGEFYKSDWESGTFSDGKFYSSKWYDGNFVNGIMGSYEIDQSDTIFYNGTVKFATVNNATIKSGDTSWKGLSSSLVVWEDGIFNKGLFTADKSRPSETFATWSSGIFNGGEFTSTAKWLNGTFNGGKFTSYYGWTQSDSMTQSDYGWENGIFNGGEFGDGNGLTNSTWYNGEFNDGLFKGRVWNYGIFLYGEFIGSGQKPVSGLTCANASDFVDSYSYSYFGKWRNGLVTDTKDRFVKGVKIFTKIQQATKPTLRRKPGKLKNILWENGTFSHPNANIEASVWLDGAFERGNFLRSSFNPYVKRGGSSQSSFNFNDDTCYWENGYLDNSDFHISKWKDGTFNIGTATGMIWQNGVANYMNAYNVFWEDGLWRNGNWNGSVWDFNQFVEEDYVRQILFRGMSWSGTSSCHIWNIFLDNSYTFESISVGATGISYYDNILRGSGAFINTNPTPPPPWEYGEAQVNPDLDLF